MENFVCQDSIIQKPVQNAEWVGIRHYTVAKGVPTVWTMLEYRRSSLVDRLVAMLIKASIHFSWRAETLKIAYSVSLVFV
jgi:hypothetical protein